MANVPGRRRGELEAVILVNRVAAEEGPKEGVLKVRNGGGIEAASLEEGTRFPEAEDSIHDLPMPAELIGSGQGGLQRAQSVPHRGG